MADNVAITAGSGTTLAADDIGGVLTPRVKVQWGPDGTVNDTDTASGKPLPIQHRTSAGVAHSYGSGTVDTGTQRVVLASDSVNTNGAKVAASSSPVAPNGYAYETVAASQTAQALGATGATGDLIWGVLVIPATTSPGNVLLLDNATSITVFTGGASSVSNLVPFLIPLQMFSVSGAWKITTGANVSCIGIGVFT